MNEQDKKLIEEIRARNEEAANSWEGELPQVGKDLAALLDIIARQDAERKEVCVGCVYKGNHNFYLQHFSENDELRKDRDRLAAECKAKDARIEALERALLSGYIEDSICYACVHQYEPNNKGGCYSAPIKDDGRGICANFQFAEARFREGGGE